MDKIFFNYGLTDITPSEPLSLAGFANRKGLSSEIHRNLSSRCLVLKQDNRILCLIINDLMDVEPPVIGEITSLISAKTGVNEDSILVASIHTHSAPVMDHGWSDANDSYIDTAIKLISGNAADIINDTDGFRPATIKAGRSRCGINIARRDIKPLDGSMAYRIGDPDGLKDEEVLILEISDDTGKRKVTLFNYACHPVTLGYGSNCVSTDYPGRAREIIEESKGGMALFVNGATGDLNPREDHNTDPEVTDREGEKLGNAVLSATLTVLKNDSEFEFISSTIEIPFRDQNVTKNHIAAEVKRKSSDITEFFTWKEMLEHWASKIYGMIDRGEIRSTFPFRVNALRIDKIIIFFTQGELFVKYQIELKKMFPDFSVFCVTYVHGTGAYIPTAGNFENKGYEADQAYIYEILPSPLSPLIETIYLNAAVGLIKKLISVST